MLKTLIPSDVFKKTPTREATNRAVVAFRRTVTNTTAKMAKKIGPSIALGVVTVLAILFLTGYGTDDKQILRDTFQVDATYYDSGYVEISFLDKSDNTDSVVLEILGMEESFHKTFSESEFLEIVPFPNLPKYGWQIHPIVLEIYHKDLGHIQLKTEIHDVGKPIPPVIYSRP